MKLKSNPLSPLLPACVLAVLVTFSVTANASLIAEGDAVLDPTSNLLWLDANVTEGLTPLQALAANPGYQLAKWTQVEGLFEDNGIPAADLPGTYNQSDYLTVGAALTAYFNYSIFPSSDPPALGETYETQGNILNAAGTLADFVSFEIDNALFQKGIQVKYFQFGNNLGNGGGSEFDFLVKPEPTPAPASLLLFASGLLGLFALQRRRWARS